MKTERWVVVLLIVLAGALLLSAVAVVAQQAGSRAPLLPTESARTDTINCMIVIGGSGTDKLVAAGTNDGIKIFEIARVGSYFEVRDVTRYATSTGAEVLRSEGPETAPGEAPAGGETPLPHRIDRGAPAPTPETPKDRLPHRINRGG